MISVDNSVLLIIDVQEKLERVMYRREELVDNLTKLVKGIQVLEVPIIVTEQYPKGLGATIPEIAQLIPDIEPLAKVNFNCYDDENFVEKLESTERKQVIISGMESHICVYQTTRELIDHKYEVYVVTDTVSSRTPENREIGLNMMKQMGAILTSTEAVLFELLKVASGDKFKAISQIVK